MTIELAPLRYIVFDYWVISLVSEAFAAWDPPCSPPLRSGARVSHTAKARKTTGLPQVAPRDDHPIIRYNQHMMRS